MVVFLLAVLSMVQPAREELHYDALIYNEVYSREGTLCFIQIGGLVLLDGNYHWEWWKIVKTEAGMPIKNGKTYSVQWRAKNRYYKATAPVLFIRLTCFDPELDDRVLRPVKARRGLRSRR